MFRSSANRGPSIIAEYTGARRTSEALADWGAIRSRRGGGRRRSRGSSAESTRKVWRGQWGSGTVQHRDERQCDTSNAGGSGHTYVSRSVKNRKFFPKPPWMGLRRSEKTYVRPSPWMFVMPFISVSPASPSSTPAATRTSRTPGDPAAVRSRLASPRFR